MDNDLIQKRSSANEKLNTFLCLVIIALLGFVLFRTEETRRQEALDRVHEQFDTEEEGRTPDKSAISPNWEQLMPEIKQKVAGEFGVSDQNKVTLLEEIDVTGDGVKDAIMSTGNGGAYTSTAVIVVVKDTTPMIATMKGNDGLVTPASFEVGSSALNRVWYGFLPEDNSFFTAYAHYSDGEVAGELLTESCVVYAYTWDEEETIFGYNAELSIETASKQCAA